MSLAADREGDPVTAVSFTAPDGTGVELTIQDAAPQLLCRDLQVGSTKIVDAVCSRPASTNADELRPIVVRTDGLTVVYGTVRDRTRQVDLAVDGRTVELDAVAPRGYEGRYAGDVRFYATAFTGEEAVLGSITLRDGRGSAVAAIDLERAALPLAGKRVRLATVEGFDRRRTPLYAIAPKVLVNPSRSPERRRPALCAAIRSEVGVAAAECALEPRRLQLGYVRGCKDAHIVFYGVGPADIARATAIYGAGRREPVRLLRVPRRVGRPGVVLYGSQDGAARLRRVVVYDSSGNRTGVARPRQTQCGEGDDSVGGGVVR